MKYPIEQINKTMEYLAALPPLTVADKETVTAHEAIALMSKVLVSLQANGYSMERMVKLLAEQGIEITSSTLRCYLRRATGEDTKATRRPTRKRTKKANETSTPAVTEAAPKARTNAKTIVPPGPIQPQEEARSTAFTVREDTDEI